MYNLSCFKTEDKAMLLQFMRQHDFIVLCGVAPDGSPVATQVPVLISEQEGTLQLEGHIMRQTDHHKAFQHNDQVLAMFVGPHAYISSSWYEDPRQAATWNYMTVHAKGRIRFGDDAHLSSILQRTTAQYEGNPSAYQLMPSSYIHKHLPAIVSFTIEVQDLQHVFKLSQNKTDADHASVVQHLQDAGGLSASLAAYMKADREQAAQK